MLSPCHHPAWFGIAYYTLKLGQGVEVLRHPVLAMALDFAPDRLKYRINLACLHCHRGDYETAWFLLESVAPTAIRCARLLRTLLPAVAHAGGTQLYPRYLKQLAHLKVRSSRNDQELDDIFSNWNWFDDRSQDARQDKRES